MARQRSTRATTKQHTGEVLREAWAAIRLAFFPRWDRGKQWRLRVGRLPGNCHGRCDADKHRITIQIVPDDADERDLLLIHETCHAETTANGPAH
jgi:hypothetical protein